MAGGGGLRVLCPFRIYTRAGEANVFRGRIMSAVAEGGPGYVSVECQLPMPLQQPKLAKDCVLRAPGLAMTVLDATTVGNHLKVRCLLPSGRSLQDLVAGSKCALVVPATSKLWRQAADVRDGSWQRVDVQELSQAKSIRFEAWRASGPAKLSGPASSIVAARWKVTLDSDFSLAPLAGTPAARNLYILTAGGTHWMSEIVHFDLASKVAELRVWRLSSNNFGAQPQSQWVAGIWSDNQFTPYKVQPNSAAVPVELTGVVAARQTTAFAISAGGVVPLTGIQPGFQRLRIVGLSGVATGADVFEILWYDADSRVIEFALTAGNTPIQLASDATWQVGQLHNTQFEVDNAAVDQPLIGDVVSAQGSDLVLGEPAPLEAFQAGARFLLIGTKLGNSVNMNGVAVLAVRQLNPTTRTVSVEGQMPEGLLQDPGNYRWAMGELTYEFERVLTVASATVAGGSDGVSSRLSVAVTAVEDRPWQADWLTYGAWQNLPGSEGRAAYARSCRVELPLAPIVLPSVPTYEYRLASRPDIDGKSYVTLRWPKSIGGVAIPAVRILRANANAVFLASVPQVPDQVMVTETVIAEWLTKSVPDQFAAAADAKARRCYAPITAGPLQTGACSDVVGPDDPAGYKISTTEAAYVDTLDGQVPGRWFYRVEPLDAQGQPATPGAVIGVEVVGVSRPAAPVLLDAYFGTKEEHDLFKAATAPEALLEVLSGIKQPSITVVWRHPDPVGKKWVVEVEREDGMFKESKVFPPFPEVESNEVTRVNFAVPTAGRWRVGMRATDPTKKVASASSRMSVVGSPPGGA